MSHYGVTLRPVESSPVDRNVWIYFFKSIRDGSVRNYIKYVVVWKFCFIKYYFEISKPPVRN